MEKLLYYVTLIEGGKLYNKINKTMVIKHIEHNISAWILSILKS